jgi:hypothetical protein
MHGEHQRRLDATNERSKIVDRPALILEGVGVDLGKCLGADPDILAVGRLVGDELRRVVAVRAGLVPTMMVWPSAFAIGSATRRA